MKRIVRAAICWLLVLSVVAMPLRAEVIQTGAALQTDRGRLDQSLAAELRPVMVERLAAAGVPHDAAAARVAALSDDAILTLAADVTDAPAGGFVPLRDFFVAIVVVAVLAAVIVVSTVVYRRKANREYRAKELQEFKERERQRAQEEAERANTVKP